MSDIRAFDCFGNFSRYGCRPHREVLLGLFGPCSIRDRTIVHEVFGSLRSRVGYIINLAALIYQHHDLDGNPHLSAGKVRIFFVS